MFGEGSPDQRLLNSAWRRTSTMTNTWCYDLDSTANADRTLVEHAPINRLFAIGRTQSYSSIALLASGLRETDTSGAAILPYAEFDQVLRDRCLRPSASQANTGALTRRWRQPIRWQRRPAFGVATWRRDAIFVGMVFSPSHKYAATFHVETSESEYGVRPGLALPAEISWPFMASGTFDLISRLSWALGRPTG